MSESSTGEFALLFNMLSDLNKKVDNIAANQVTRHEFETLYKRIDTMVVKAEFDAYKEAHNQWAISENATIKQQLLQIVPRIEHESKWDEINREIAELKSARGSWKAWMFPVLGGIAGSALTFGSQLLHH